MANRWALAFSLSALLALVGTAGLRASGRRARGRRIRRLGGVVLTAATLAGWLFAPAFPVRVGVLALGAAALTLFGALDEYLLLPSWSRLAVLAGAAVAAAVVVDVRAEPTGAEAVDLAVTILWVLVLASAVRGLDETDGLAAAMTVAVGAGVFALAGFGDQTVVATMAAALAGACCGFLAYNVRPASVFLADAGALSLGYLLATLSIEVRPTIDAPGGYVVPLLLAAVPLLDVATVTLGRLRRDGGFTDGGRDHLAHRLVARGLRRTPAILVLVAVQLGLGAAAVFVGRGVLPVGWGVGLGGGVVVALALVTASAPVHPEAPAGLTGRARLVVLGLPLAAGVVAAPALLAAMDSRRLMDDGRAAVEAALTAARDGKDALAEAKFTEAATAFGRAHDRLDAPWARPGLAVPVLGPNLEAARDLSEAGAELAQAGARLTGDVDPERLRVVGGRVPLEEVRRLTPDLEEGAALLADVARDVEGIDDPFLFPPVRDTVDRLQGELGDAKREANRVAAAARLAPAILGGENGSRRYFLAVQNSAESRATGGFIGNWGVLIAEDGDVRLEDFERVGVLNEGGEPGRAIDRPEDFVRRYGRFDPANTWQNVNMSPDFPTVGQVIAGLYPQSGGEPVDGVIAVDPVGLAALLELTGPVTVEGWDAPLTAQNVVDVTLRDAYVAFERDQREDFLGDVAERVVDTATDGELGEPADIARVLGKAAHEGHIALSFVRPEEQGLAELLDVAGGVPPVRSDSLLVTTQNAAGNKLDYYLRRRLDYRVTLSPRAEAEDAQVRGTLAVTLDSTAVVPGLPQEVAGPYDERFTAGENRSFVSLYTPAGFDAATLDGAPVGLEATTELGRNVFSSFVSVSAGTSRTLALDLAGTVELTADGWYSLDLVRQPSLHPDEVTVSVAVPPGWRIAETVGLETDGRRATARVTLDRHTRVRLRLEPADPSLWDRLDQGP
ncbi:MAG: DUF4012 domain-containing protein [Acidimicrobiia bacterium]